MSGHFKNQRGSVAILNQPKVTEYEADKEFNDRRKGLSSEIKDFIEGHPLFSGKHTEVTFSHNGISSLVCILNTKDKKFVLKIPLKLDYSRSEGKFLAAWERVGVKVPHVVETGEIGLHSYMLMDYVDALTLKETYDINELIEKEIYVEMGAVLKNMHATTANGYGDLIEGNGEYPDIRAWLESSMLGEKFSYVKENGLLNEEKHGSLGKAHEILFAKIGSDPSTVYGHSDFSIGNVFATKPLTVFDPIPFLNHPYMDLARTITLAVRAGSFDVSKHLIKGYFKDETYDSQLLQAALVTNAYMKVRYWHLTGRQGAVKNLQEYLAETASFLQA